MSSALSNNKSRRDLIREVLYANNNFRLNYEALYNPESFLFRKGYTHDGYTIHPKWWKFKNRNDAFTRVGETPKAPEYWVKPEDKRTNEAEEPIPKLEAVDRPIFAAGACAAEKKKIIELEAKLKQSQQKHDIADSLRSFIISNKISPELVERGAYLTVREKKEGKWTISKSWKTLPRFEKRVSVSTPPLEDKSWGLKKTPLGHEVIQVPSRAGGGAAIRVGDLVDDIEGNKLTVVVPFLPLTHAQVKDGWRVRLDPSSKQIALYQRPRDGGSREASMSMVIPASDALSSSVLRDVEMYLLNRIQRKNTIMKQRKTQQVRQK